jgi:hypothetical protein
VSPSAPAKSESGGRSAPGGATSSSQFLVETVLLAGAGGVLGVLLGVFIPFIVTQTLE